ncbi:MAG: YaeQ family protein [Pseudomonadales bacterium]
MALKPTIYKFEVHLSNLDRNYFDTLNLTVAQHPSESVERMWARILALCLNADPDLKFTRGVSATDEPDLWQHDDTGAIQLWVDIGEPSLDRIKKALRQARQVKIYSINRKSDIWWQAIETAVANTALKVAQISWDDLEALAKITTRTNSLAVTITESCLHISLANQFIEVYLRELSKKR